MKINQPLPQIPGASGTPGRRSASTSQARPSRSNSEGALQGLAAVRGGTPQQCEEPSAHRRSASFPAEMQDQNAPAWHELIGREKVGELDARFGSLQPAFNLATDGIKDWEREGGVSTGKPLMHERRVIISDVDGRVVDLTSEGIRHLVDLEAVKRGEKIYNWTVSGLGRLFIGEAEPAGVDPQTGQERYRGHPMLVGGGPARISGELLFNADTGKFVVSNRSGRYSRYEDRTEAQLLQVANLFTLAGLEVEIEVVEKYKTRKRANLVLPSLDPSRRPAGTSRIDLP
ncbi:MAG TPA: type III effector protein [Burkholderiaceae bacterium]|nr:type III effector protein [Burkholderiaceae bacterium]